MADQNALLLSAGFSGITDVQIAGFIGKTLTTAEKAVANSLVASTEQYIANQCQRNFKDLGNTDSYYEVVDAGLNKYYLKAFPIKEIRKIEVDGVVKYLKGGTNNVLTLGRDFIVYDDYVWFDYPLMSALDNRRAMRIYYAIESVVGEDLKLAVQQWASDLFLNREYAGKTLASQSSAGISLNFEASTIPTYVKQVISVYRKVLI